jgi:hypothetical protein
VITGSGTGSLDLDSDVCAVHPDLSRLFTVPPQLNNVVPRCQWWHTNRVDNLKVVWAVPSAAKPSVATLRWRMRKCVCVCVCVCVCGGGVGGQKSHTGAKECSEEHKWAHTFSWSFCVVAGCWECVIDPRVVVGVDPRERVHCPRRAYRKSPIAYKGRVEGVVGGPARTQAITRCVCVCVCV